MKWTVARDGIVDWYDGPKEFLAYDADEKYPVVYLFRWHEGMGTDSNRLFVSDLPGGLPERSPYYVYERDFDFASSNVAV